MNPPRLTLKYALPDLPSVLQFVEGEAGCTTITPTGHGGFWVIMGRVHRYCPDWRVDTFVREDPPPPDSKCKVCGKAFDGAHALKIHMGMSHAEKVR